MGRQWAFDGYRLDPDDACLWRGTELIRLQPKTFDVLRYLVAHAGRLVARSALLDACWHDTIVGDAALTVCVAELRKALGDSADTPRLIATVHRRGYRFIAPVSAADAGPTRDDAASASAPASSRGPRNGSPVAESRPLVEREGVLESMHAALALARQGAPQLVFVTGEAGLGKTVVVDTFLQRISRGPVWAARGQCVEHHVTSEAYSPILEALGVLCRAEGEGLVEILRRQAPTWFVQMPWLLTRDDRVQLQHELEGSTRERMLREFAELLDALTADAPLVLVLEDLHWSDHPTLDLLAFVARRRQTARWMIVGTFRPVDTIVHEHPLRAVAQSLRRLPNCRELPLALLSPSAIEWYLTAECPGLRFPDELSQWLHWRTDGHPLFLVSMVQMLIQRGLLRPHDGVWEVRGDFDATITNLPDDLRPFLDQQLERLASKEQRVLEVASAAGVEFAVDAVAAALEGESGAVEEHCEALVRLQMLRALGMITWPDGTATTRYAFAHALYHEAAYQRLGHGRRRRLHQRIGLRLETAYGARAGEIASELARHFELGHDPARTVQYLQEAASNAAQRCAPHEVIERLRRALELLERLPATPGRAQQELAMQLALGWALLLTSPAAADIEHTYSRARALCAEVGESPQLFAALRGLSFFYRNRGALTTARELGEELLALTRRETVPGQRMEALETLGCALFYQGDYASARALLEEGSALSESVRLDTATRRSAMEISMMCSTYASHVLWCLGYPVQARRRRDEARTRVEESSNAVNRTIERFWAAYLGYRCREAPIDQAAHAEALVALATVQDLPLYVALGTCLRGSALVAQGHGATGIEQIRHGLAMIENAGQAVSRPFVNTLLAEAMGRVGQVEDALRAVADAFTAFESSGRGDMLTEAHRLRGELLLQSGAKSAEEAEACFHEALAIARRQHAKSWELRAAVSLAKFWLGQGKPAAARELLGALLGWFTEGFDTPDVQDAKALFDSADPAAERARRPAAPRRRS